MAAFFQAYEAHARNSRWMCNIGGWRWDSPQDVAETERQRRVVSPDETDPFQLGMCGGVCRGGKWQGGRGSPDVWAGWWEGGGRRERTGLRLNAGKRLVRSYGGGFGGGSLSAAMAFMLSLRILPHMLIFLPCIIRVQNRTMS